MICLKPLNSLPLQLNSFPNSSQGFSWSSLPDRSHLPAFCPSSLSLFQHPGLFSVSYICHIFSYSGALTTCLEACFKICYGCLLLICLGIDSNTAFLEKSFLSSLMKPTLQLTLYHVTQFFCCCCLVYSTYQHPKLFSYVFIYRLHPLPPPLGCTLLVVRKLSFPYIAVNPVASTMPGTL